MSEWLTASIVIATVALIIIVTLAIALVVL